MAIFSGLGALISGALFGGSLLAAKLIGGALAFGAQIGLGKLTNKQKKQKFTAVQGEVQMGGDVPVDALLGTGKTRGQRAYYAKWGKGNKVNADVFILANGWCDGLENYCYFYGEKKNLVARPIIGGEVAHFGVDGFGDLVSIRFYDGRPGQPVDQKLVNDTAGLGKVWKATSRLSGLAYVVVERRYDSSKFDKGRPEFEWVLRGLREYDPTKDSTVAGGNGPQRLNDPSTWTHTLNPAIHRLNYQLGLRGLRSGRTLIGEGKSLGQLDLSSYFVAINYCRTLRKGKPIYQCSLWVNSETDHTEALSAFDDAMAGYGLNRRGLSGVVVGAPQIPVLEITEKDIPADRPKPRQPRKSAFDLINHLSGQFTSPAAMWNPESLKPIVVNADVAADKRARQTSIDFLQVSDADIAQYLLNVRYRQNRRGGTATVPVSRRVGLKAMEGEWVSYLGKVWMISEWRCDEDLRFTFVLSEAGADIYDDADIVPGPIVIPPIPPINPSLLFTVQNFDVFAGMIQGGNGFDVPALEFVWTPPDDPTITDVLFVYRVDGTLEDFTDQCAEPESGRHRTTKNVLSDKIYAGRATIKTNPDRLRTFTPWRTTAGRTGMLNVQVGLGQVRDDVLDRFKDIQKELSDSIERMDERLLEFSLANAIGQRQRLTLRAELGNALAQIVEERRVRVSGDEALAQSILVMQASLNTTNARLSQEETTRATETSALTQSTLTISAELKDRFAGGMVKFSAAADQSGVNVRYAMVARANIGDAYKEVGQYLEIYTVNGVLKSRSATITDQWVVSDGTTRNYPMVYEGGVLKLNIADIGTVYAGTMSLGGGKVIVNANGFEVWH
ncbi:phage tail protein [Ensifer sp. ENS06]|uniref:phage tail protein n=1 Tax=Ensifer sp. ENS06 TaxID=2769276 RepID=UPI00177F7DF2|nr:phage tail protein [Ensifer sp. ENS06]MBD9621896.1 phage tail protein [Ensifer sp. ENS06]